MALVYGGASGEHEVSLKSAASILENVDYEKYEVKPYFVNKENQWFAQGVFKEVGIQLSNSEDQPFNPFDLKTEVDVVFPITHGPFGEDGHYQAIFELLNLPYVGCDVLSSAISMDKAVMKDIFKANGINQGKYHYFTEHIYNESTEETIEKIERELGYPCFIKPANLGSSVGISKAKDRESLQAALTHAFTFDQKVVVEEFIQGRELEIGFLGNDRFELSAVGEIATGAEFYDYDAKYISTDGNQMYIPADIPEDVEERIHLMAAEVVRVLGVKGISRIDFFYVEGPDWKSVLVNEINTLPGFTKDSMYPSLFAAVDIPYQTLITRLLENAIENQKGKKRHSN